ncbi:major facilitator superfamily transporter [Lindgomyces ingoldianus]|uniref:Major facilitator superfamily transporter n=1 Tax=Lindgomyces ingoldianus TaxID=673940 RepID=A0ACB6QUB4_9PLEO|nr:major facilitator superfamily transporter [Lindgomyces ingoldianus]KAF2470168.1 major facilitator superfamily transporter [Lindgomyces ingoldianus]
MNNKDAAVEKAPRPTDTTIENPEAITEPSASTISELKDPDSETPKEDTTEYPTGVKLYTIVACLFAPVFLVALDRTIIGTAVPKITDEFHSIDDIGWYASAFLLPGCSFMLMFAKLYQLYPIKWVYLLCVTTFEIGSAICGAAPTSTALIVGRAIAGLGSSGLFSGTIIILVHKIPLARRPLFQGMFGAVFGLASVVGPLLGGAFTDKVSWRWCFYINLPIGGVTIIGLLFFLHVEGTNLAKTLTPAEQARQLDPIGTLAFLPGVICLLLALQWGGSTYPWSNGRVIACLVLAGILLTVFILVQIYNGEKATLPPRILKLRSILSALWYSFFSGSSMMVVVYYIPIWFQTIKGVSAVNSGIRTIALILALVAASMTGGSVTYRTGYYTPCMIVGSMIMSIGAGLLTTWTVDTDRAKWIGYQVIYGFGMGLGMQQPNIAIQTTLSKRDVPTGTALVFFVQQLGGAVLVSAAQNVFASKLRIYLAGIQGINVPEVIHAGATGLRLVVPKELLRAVLVASNRALMKVFLVGVVVSCLGIVGALTMEWRSIKDGEGQGERPKEKKGDEEEGKEKVGEEIS